MYEELKQDCIAVYRELTGGGALVGPRADAWGPFNPEYFLLLDGRRLRVDQRSPGRRTALINPVATV